jgi:hypothetical protein
MQPDQLVALLKNETVQLSRADLLTIFVDERVQLSTPRLHTLMGEEPLELSRSDLQSLVDQGTLQLSMDEIDHYVGRELGVLADLIKQQPGPRAAPAVTGVLDPLPEKWAVVAARGCGRALRWLCVKTLRGLWRALRWLAGLRLTHTRRQDARVVLRPVTPADQWALRLLASEIRGHLEAPENAESPRVVETRSGKIVGLLRR